MLSLMCMGVAKGPRPGNVKPYLIPKPLYHLPPSGATEQDDKLSGEDTYLRSTRRVSL